MKNRTRIATSVSMILISVVSLSIVLTAIEYATAKELTDSHIEVLERFEIGTLHAFIITKPMWSEYPLLPGIKKAQQFWCFYASAINVLLLTGCCFGLRLLKKPMSRHFLSLFVFIFAIGLYFILNSLTYFIYERSEIFESLGFATHISEFFYLQTNVLVYSLLWCIGLSLFDIREVIKSRTPTTMSPGSRTSNNLEFNA